MAYRPFHRHGQWLIWLILYASPAWGAWIQDGPSVNGNSYTSATFPSLALFNGAPYVAYVENGETAGPAGQIIVKHYQDGIWHQDGVSLNVDDVKAASRPDLAVFKDSLYAVWSEQQSSSPAIHTVYVGRFNGSGWERIGAAISANIADSPEPFLLGTPRRLYLAWHEQDYNHVRYLDGADWIALSHDPADTGLNGTDVVTRGAATLAWFNNSLYAAFSGGNHGPGQVIVKHYSEAQSAWIMDVASLNMDAGQDAYAPAVTAGGNQLYAAWWETTGVINRVFVKYEDAGIWKQLGTSLNVSQDQHAYMPVIAWAGEMPWVIWYESGESGVRVKRFHQGVWENLSDTPLNLDITENGPPEDPDIAVDNQTVYVAWAEGAWGQQKVYVKHFNISPDVPTPTATCTPIAADSTRSIYALPNPFLPARVAKTRFYALQAWTDGCTIRIFNLRGKVVRTLTDEPAWDGRNDSGQMCEGGVYLVQAKTGNIRLEGQVVLIK